MGKVVFSPFVNFFFKEGNGPCAFLGKGFKLSWKRLGIMQDPWWYTCLTSVLAFFLCRTNHNFTLSGYLCKVVKHTSDFTSRIQCRLSSLILSLSELKKVVKIR